MKQKQRLSVSERVARWISDAEHMVAIRFLDGGRTSLYRTAEGWLGAELSGTGFRPAKVLFSCVAGDVIFSCDCGIFADRAQPCPHLLAAVDTAEYNGYVDPHGYLVAKRVQELPEDLPGLEAKRWGMVPLTGKPRALSAPEAASFVGSLAKPRLVWKPLFESVRRSEEAAGSAGSAAKPWPRDRQVLYVIDVPRTLDGKGLVLETMSRDPAKGGGWKQAKPLGTNTDLLAKVHEPLDREIIALLVGASAPREYYYSYDQAMTRRMLSEAHAAALLPRLCKTGRLHLRMSEYGEFDPQPLAWDEGPPWNLSLEVRRDEESKSYLIEGALRRGGGGGGGGGEGEAAEERVALSEPTMLTHRGHVFLRGNVAPLEDFGAFGWVVALRAKKSVRVPEDEADDLLAELYNTPRLPMLRLAEGLAVREDARAMRPALVVRKARISTSQYSYYGDEEALVGELSFEYGDQSVKGNAGGAGIYDRKQRLLVKRDTAAEQAAGDRLQRAGFRLTHDYKSEQTVARIKPKALPGAIRGLLHEGWKVEAEGKLYRTPGHFDVEVTSGIDWFDLNVKADFGGVSAPLPRLLAALRKGESLVQLDDGTFGMVPEEWLRKYGGLAGVGKEQGDAVRFSRTQVGLLDALLAAQPQARFDETFRRTRDELHRFSGVAPQDPPASFIGELRPYQKEALGWFDFLRRFSFGGCLADDMGLGKTVQVLALLESRRGSGGAKPSLVVVPRSLVFNWKQEAARFAPGLRVLDHTTPFRDKDAAKFAGYEVVLTTYGTLRKDAPYLKDVEFDYVVLDEAQAIKNAASESAKAVRLLRGQHRLVLSGTPVQNHLGDLWSLFEFLNPGMLGTVTAFNASPVKAADEETRKILSRGLRPFILRRTKEQVARELPARVEQTLYCELEAEQRKLYDELREHYRQSLLGQIEREGMAKAKIQILEALLRLRQAAIHPGLIDKTRTAENSAKLDMLLPQLAEITEEGHKALVFSQFTGMLSILRKKLDAEKVVYEYLDGKTKDRQARVERFQGDPDCKLFLISLKAGGVGLNLTGADYVFLLDPWWNPAVEAQAIDRTHRIGQTKQVFAFRLIAKGTVEEKVLALQESKRDLADAIINADNSLIRTLGREDLEMLLS